MNLEELQSLYDFSNRMALVTGVFGSEIACAPVGCNANVANCFAKQVKMDDL